MRITMDHIQDHPPNSEWILNVLGIFQPDCEVFAKDYVAPKDQVGKAEKMLADPLGMFSGLPEKRKPSKKKLRIPVSQQAKNEEQLARLLLQERDIGMRIRHLQEKQKEEPQEEEESKAHFVKPTKPMQAEKAYPMCARAKMRQEKRKQAEPAAADQEMQ